MRSCSFGVRNERRFVWGWGQDGAEVAPPPAVAPTFTHPAAAPSPSPLSSSPLPTSCRGEQKLRRRLLAVLDDRETLREQLHEVPADGDPNAMAVSIARVSWRGGGGGGGMRFGSERGVEVGGRAEWKRVRGGGGEVRLRCGGRRGVGGSACVMWKWARGGGRGPCDVEAGVVWREVCLR